MGKTDSNGVEGSGPRRRRPSTDIPQHEVKDALRVARAIEEANAGQPYPPAETALAMGMSPGSSSYWKLLSSSLRYGLTTGSYRSPRIDLTALAKDFMTPTSAEEQKQRLVQAALTPPTFAAIFNHYRGKKLPEMQFFANTVVREFEVPQEVAADCVEIFRTNMEYLGLLNKGPTGTWLSSEAVPMAAGPEIEADAASGPAVPLRPAGDPAEQPAELAEDVPAKPAAPPSIFVGHGKNRKPLEQLVKILNEYGIAHKVVLDEPNQGRPISEKVAETMKSCGAAILIFTADQELRDAEGSTLWRPSENVIYELGAASTLYGRRIIIFKEEGVDFPTNFRDIGHIPFGKDDLASQGMDLVRELIRFGVMKLTLAA
jgi:predicted nucleotide-binding protein